MQDRKQLENEFQLLLKLFAYMKLGSLEELTQKVVGKPPVRIRYRIKSSGRKKTIWYCRNCEKQNIRVYRGDKYCRECGTKILWNKIGR